LVFALWGILWLLLFPVIVHQGVVLFVVFFVALFFPVIVHQGVVLFVAAVRALFVAIIVGEKTILVAITGIFRSDFAFFLGLNSFFLQLMDSPFKFFFELSRGKTTLVELFSEFVLSSH